MKQLMKMALIGGMLLLAAACGGGGGGGGDDYSLVGQWSLVANNGQPAGNIWLQFNSDGNGWAQTGNVREYLTWSYGNGRLTVRSKYTGKVYVTPVTWEGGNRMTLGGTMTYARVHTKAPSAFSGASSSVGLGRLLGR